MDRCCCSLRGTLDVLGNHSTTSKYHLTIYGIGPMPLSPTINGSEDPGDDLALERDKY